MSGVLLVGEETPFGTHLKLRLERIGFDCSDQSGLKIVCWEAGEATDCDLAIRPSSSESYPATAQCELVIHDMYIPGGSGEWGPKEIENHLISLQQDAVGEGTSGKPRHWVHVRDVVDAVADLLQNLPSGRLDVCGRRAWPHAVMAAELEMLYSRTIAAETKSFQLENLKTSEISIELEERISRPDLSKLHAALLDIRGEGWHPLASFRLGLMECIAHHQLNN